MKKAILTIGLFSMVMVLTSFTTPDESLPIINQTSAASKVYLEILPEMNTAKYDSGSYLNEPGGGTPSYPRKLDFEPGGGTPSYPRKLDFEPGGGTPSYPRKID